MTGSSSIMVAGLILVLAALPAVAADDAKIIPARDDAAGGGNPFEGLGRPDDPNPSRRDQYENPQNGASTTAGSETGGVSGQDEAADKEKDSVADEASAEARDRAIADEKLKRLKQELRESAKPDTPLRRALADISLRKYPSAMEKLETILLKDPNCVEAHYLKAVALVMQRQYQQAKIEYSTVIKLSPDTEIGFRAKEGITKLGP